MEDCGVSVSSSLFTDSNVMSAVASLIARHQVAKEEAIGLNIPMLVLSNAPDKEALNANVVLSSNHGSGPNKQYIGTDMNSSRESLVPSFEQVHALATANLLASTQRDIVQQLAEANSMQNATKKPELKSKKSQNCNKKRKEKAESTKHCHENNKDEEKKSVDFNSKATTSSPGVKALECSFKGCNRKFAWLTHLKYHELTHTNNRQFECPDENCGKTFFTAQRLKVHLRTHTGERPFICSHADCGKTFTTAGNLKNHQRIHTGEQPFVCDYHDCNRRFTEYSSLHKHKLTHSGDKPFRCKVCDKKFTQSGSRQQHILRHHLDDEIRDSLKSKTSIMDEVETKSKDNQDLDKMSEKDVKLISPISNGPQVVFLKNTYQELNEQMVTSATHQLVDSNSLSLSQTFLSTDGLQNDPLDGKSDELVVLSETPIFRQEEHPGSIVYTSNILDHEEVNQADYASSHVEYSEEIASNAFVKSEEINSDVNFSQQGVAQTDVYQSHESFIHGENLHVPSFVDSKGASQSYLDDEGEVIDDFIGAEEVTVSHYHNITSTEDNLSAASHFSDVKEEVVSQMDPLMEWDEHLQKP